MFPVLIGIGVLVFSALTSGCEEKYEEDLPPEKTLPDLPPPGKDFNLNAVFNCRGGIFLDEATCADQVNNFQAQVMKKYQSSAYTECILKNKSAANDLYLSGVTCSISSQPLPIKAVAK